MRLLFISSRFPDSQEPGRGVENVDLLNALADRWEIRVVALRPVSLWSRRDWHSRATDVALRAVFQSAPCLPAFGRRWNHHFYARALRKRLGAIRRDWRFDAVLTAGLHPDACAVALLRNEFQFRFVVTAPDAGAREPGVSGPAENHRRPYRPRRGSGHLESRTDRPAFTDQVRKGPHPPRRESRDDGRGMPPPAAPHQPLTHPMISKSAVALNLWDRVCGEREPKRIPLRSPTVANTPPASTSYSPARTTPPVPRRIR